MLIFKDYTNNTNPNSLAAKLRSRRFSLFLNLVNKSEKKPLNILDVGGTEIFWDIMQFDSATHNITILNLETIPQKDRNIRIIKGDARNMINFKDKEFDVVFSNSVIEHVGNFKDQTTMANEIRRVGAKYFLQTPSYSFFFEPHFLFPFLHWMPAIIRTILVYVFHPGWYGRDIRTWNDAKKAVTSIRLLKKSELRVLFPDAVIKKEKFIGLTKSYIVVKN